MAGPSVRYIEQCWLVWSNLFNAGFVLATKHVEEGESITIDSIRAMLTVFGSVASSRSIPMPNSAGSPTSPATPSITVALFEFYSIHDAAAAVEAIGSRARSSFSLYLVTSDGTLLSPADPRFPARLTVRSSSAGESSIPSFSSDRAGSTSAAVAAMGAQIPAQIPFPTFSSAPRTYSQAPIPQPYGAQPWIPSAPPHMQPPLPGPLNMPPGARTMHAVLDDAGVPIGLQGRIHRHLECRSTSFDTIWSVMI